MRQVPKPQYAGGSIFRMCASSVQNRELRDRLLAIANEIAALGTDYDRLALVGELFALAAHQGNNTDITLGQVSKQELKDVYSQHMVGKGKPARAVYEAILGLAPQGLCPLCGFAHAETVDHYLSKDGFPQYSVLPINLIPACWPCNHGKRDSLARTAGEQPLHPYYDHGHYISDQWLFAEVKQTTPVTIRYFVNPPVTWDFVSQERIESHFSGYNLSRKFSVQAISELSAIRYSLTNFCRDQVSRRARLLEEAATQFNLHRNSWKTSLYQALANCDWYCEWGYQQA